MRSNGLQYKSFNDLQRIAADSLSARTCPGKSTQSEGIPRKHLFYSAKTSGVHDLPARGLRNGPRARDQQQGRSGVQARRPVRETAPADAGLGEVLRRLEAIRGRCVDLASKGLTWLLMLSTDGASTSTGLQIEERIEAPRVRAQAISCPERRFLLGSERAAG